MNQEESIFLGLGSNLGDRERQLCEALDLLHASVDIAVMAVSSVYETEPWGMKAQPAFLNMACRIETALSQEALLCAVLAVERRLGRCRAGRWGPRTVDIDILLWGQTLHRSRHLSIPHPHLHERLFVLAPLAEMAPQMNVPGLNRRIKDLLERCPDTGAIKRIKSGVDLWRKPKTSRM